MEMTWKYRLGKRREKITMVKLRMKRIRKKRMRKKQEMMSLIVRREVLEEVEIPANTLEELEKKYMKQLVLLNTTLIANAKQITANNKQITDLTNIVRTQGKKIAALEKKVDTLEIKVASDAILIEELSVQKEKIDSFFQESKSDSKGPFRAELSQCISHHRQSVYRFGHRTVHS